MFTAEEVLKAMLAMAGRLKCLYCDSFRYNPSECEKCGSKTFKLQ